MKSWHCAFLTLALLVSALGAEEAKPAPSAEPKAEASVAPKGEKAPEAKAEVTPTPKGEKPPEPKAEVSPAPKGETASESKVQAPPATPVEGAAPKGQEAAGKGSGTTDWERYQILIRRNVFSKSRGREREDARKAPPLPPPPKPEAETVLIGIAEKDGQLQAFLENTKTGAVKKARKDDPVARGKIAAITLNNIEYECEGKTVVIVMGSNLEGGTSVKGGDSPKAATTSASSTGSGDAGSVLERLRRKRLEEMNK